MRNPVEFWSKDNRFGLRIFASEMNLLLDFCEKSGLVETGGILIGKYTSAHDCAVVSEVTPPPLDSKRGRFWFKRGVRGLRNKLKTLWDEKSVYYLGEWHFHPEGAPDPSETDFNSLKGISESSKYNCPEPLLIIIGGSFPENWNIRVFVFLQNKSLLELQQIDKSNYT
jgi:integrative and conjugative element protein (TIGR02256 family)